jgi:hypothetical protein
MVDDDGPAEADEFVFAEDGCDGADGALGADVVEGRDPKFESVAAGVAGFEIELLRGVRSRGGLDPRLRAPRETPVFADEAGEEGVVLRVDTVERKIGVGGGKRGLVRVLALDERAVRGVAVDDDF